MKLSIQLTSIMLIAIVFAVAAVGYVSFTVTSASLEKSIGENQQELAKETLDKIDRILYRKYQDIQIIAETEASEELLTLLSEEELYTEEAAAAAAAANREILQEHKFLTGPWDVILLADKNGEIVISTSTPLQKMTTDQQTAFSFALNGEVYNSDLVISQTTGKPTMIFAAPVRNEDDTSRPVIGAVVAEFSWPVVLEVFDELGFSSERHMHMFNKEGITIGTPTIHKKEILQRDLNFIGVVQEALRGKCSSSSSSSSSFLMHGEIHQEDDSHLKAEHIPTLSSCALQTGHLGYESQGWGIIIETPQDIAFGPVQQLVKHLLLIFLVVILLFIPIILLISRTISKPLEILTESNKDIIKGKFKKAQQQQQQQQQFIPNEIKEMIETRQIMLKGLVHKTELEKKQKQLVKANHEVVKFAQAISSSINAVAISDLKGRLTYVNQAFVNMFGYSSIEAIKMKIPQFVAKQNLDKLNKTIIPSIKQRGNYIGELLGMRKDKTKFSLFMSAFLIKDENAKPISMMASFIDITEKKKSERKLKQAKNQLQKQVSELERWNKITINRELKMIELKKKIAKMKKGRIK
jgi:PAS domain S-box-containing protein